MIADGVSSPERSARAYALRLMQRDDEARRVASDEAIALFRQDAAVAAR